MHVDLVFVTKCRGQVFAGHVLDELRALFDKTCADFKSKLVAFEGGDDHVHLRVSYPPKVAISTLVNSLKGVSSRMIRQRDYPGVRDKLWDGALWSPSYFAASTGEAPAAAVRQFIESQQIVR